ncbi:MAG TPA: phage tail assembly chaperone [Burkholderiales bacterium]|nr:phage tail assembly chaperone [Burkholderiales bacterium]HUY04374.1 phage tail assembly chaperone [Rhodocyclaceae bacterium]
MFKIKADPTFDATLTIIGQGREQQLNVTFKHKTRGEYQSMLQKIADGKLDAADALLQLVAKWDADGELSKANIKLLQDEQPGSDWAIITGYGEALAVARKGN